MVRTPFQRGDGGSRLGVCPLGGEVIPINVRVGFGGVQAEIALSYSQKYI